MCEVLPFTLYVLRMCIVSYRMKSVKVSDDGVAADDKFVLSSWLNMETLRGVLL